MNDIDDKIENKSSELRRSKKYSLRKQIRRHKTYLRKLKRFKIRVTILDG